MSEPANPSDATVQQLLLERRELRVTVERLRLELRDAGSAATADPTIDRLKAELARLRHQLADVRAEVHLLEAERDELRAGIRAAVLRLTKKE